MSKKQKQELELILAGLKELETRGGLLESDKIERQLNLVDCLIRLLDRRSR